MNGNLPKDLNISAKGGNEIINKDSLLTGYFPAALSAFITKGRMDAEDEGPTKYDD